jgi:electron transport complex protein RnfD
MNDQKKLIVSHAPFLHNGTSIPARSYNMMLAALPAVVMSIVYFGVPVIAVVSLSIATAIFWEWAMNRITKRPETIGDGNAALLGLLFAMLLPPTTPWWVVLTGTFVCIVVGKEIFGGIGSNAFHPAVLSLAILMVSWPGYFNFDQAVVDYDLGFPSPYPLAALKYFGLPAVTNLSMGDLLLGRQVGAIGATFGLGLIAGGIYLIIRGHIRWEIAFSFLAGIIFTATLFKLADPDRFAGATFHLFTGYTLLGAFFLATEDSSSPVNFIPMLIYGAAGGIMTILIRNIGAHIDGVIYAILVINLINPLLDNIRPKALGKVV